MLQRTPQLEDETGEAADDQKGTGKQPVAADEQPRDDHRETALEEHRAEGQRPSGRHGGWQHHRDQPVGEPNHQHGGPSDRGKMRVRKHHAERGQREEALAPVEPDKDSQRRRREDVDEGEAHVKQHSRRGRRPGHSSSDEPARSTMGPWQGWPTTPCRRRCRSVKCDTIPSTPATNDAKATQSARRTIMGIRSASGPTM